jgi:hypothetical protein
VTASPRAETERFVDQVRDFCAARCVDLIVPTWEEAFYLSDGLREVPGSIHDPLRIPGADRGWHDELPNRYTFLAFCHHERLSLREHEALQVAMYEDVSWDGEPIAGMTAGQSVALAALHGD